MLRAFPVIVAALFCLRPAPAGAAHNPAAGFPWTFSMTGTERADSISVDSAGNVWVAGLWNRLGAGDDVLLLRYSNAGVLAGTSWYDRDNAGRPEGPPQIKTQVYLMPSQMPIDEVWLAFTTNNGTDTDATIVKTGAFTGSIAIQTAPDYIVFNENLSFSESASGLFMGGDDNPFLAGTLDSGGVEQSLYVWHTRNVTKDDEYPIRVTATYWSGSAVDITGRAIAVDSGSNAWIVAETGGDLMLLHYSDESYEGVGPGDWKAPLFPGFPRTYATPAVDDPRACALDAQGSLWVAGSIDGDAAVWKFDWQGNMAPGFPQRHSSPGADVLRSLVLDEKGRAFATGTLNGSLAFFGYDSSGAVLPGYPLTWAGSDVLEGRGLVLDPYGNAWIAGTLSSAAGSTVWQGSVAQIYKFDYVTEAPEIAFGSVALRAPKGGILNLARGETMRIVAYPASPGDIKIQVMTSRGETVRELSIASTGGGVVSCEWDGRNAAGNEVASGVYAIRVRGGGLSVVKRAAVVRRK